MKLLYTVSFLLIACSTPDEPDVSTSESEIASPEGQGTEYQGTEYQGTEYQGTEYQGTEYQGTEYQGATYGGTTLSDAASISGTALSVWVPHGSGWKQLLPDKVCYWNSSRTAYSQTPGCKAAVPSPLVGVTFKAAFRRPLGECTPFRWGVPCTMNGTIRIGAVTADTKLAMHPLTSFTMSPKSAPPPVCEWVPKGPDCENPNGCRRNCDIWMYSLTLIDGDGSEHAFCSGGTKATAVPNTYDATGKVVANSARFTFACEKGTIAKCTRWGYRPFGYAKKHCNATYQPGCGTNTALHALSPMHQSCVRAATADYCANGTSFTKNGTLVDVYDYDAASYQWGFVPKTRSSAIEPTATAFVWESGFDKYGALWIAHMRYQELIGTPFYGDFESDADGGCSDRFARCGGDDACGDSNYVRSSDIPYDFSSVVHIDSTPPCSHSELTVGTYLHPDCSGCTRAIANSALSYCTDPTDGRGWDQTCATTAAAQCSSNIKMTSHSECTAGAALKRYATGCTLAVCSTSPSCCETTGPGWDSACAAKANTVCGTPGFNTVLDGFCNDFEIEPSPTQTAP